MSDDSNTPLRELEQLAPGGPHEPTYPIAAGARALRKSERWYVQQLKAGRFPGHKAGRTWFLTTTDIAEAIEATRRPATAPTIPPASKQPASQTRRSGQHRTRRRRPIPPQNR